MYCSLGKEKLLCFKSHIILLVLNAAARLVFSARKTEHTSPLLRELHWLKVPEGAHQVPVICADVPLSPRHSAKLPCRNHSSSFRLATRRHLRSADTSTLLVPTTRCLTLGDRAFPAAAARAWNSLPCHVRDMPSLIAFRRELKTVLFRLSYRVDR